MGRGSLPRGVKNGLFWKEHGAGMSTSCDPWKNGCASWFTTGQYTDDKGKVYDKDVTDSDWIAEGGCPKMWGPGACVSGNTACSQCGKCTDRGPNWGGR